MDLILADVTFISGNADWFVDAGKLAEVFDATVHGLVGVAGKGPVACEGDILILLQDGLASFFIGGRS